MTLGMTKPDTTMTDMRDIPGACPYCSTPTRAVFHHGPCPERNKLRLDIRVKIEGPQFFSEDFEEKVTKIIAKEVRRAT